MRNHYYPRHIAAYVTMVEAKDIKRNSIMVERDVLFGRDVDKPTSERVKLAARKAKEVTKVDIQMMAVSAERQCTATSRLANALQPEDAFKALSDAIPPRLDFYRAVISAPEASTSPESERDEAKAAQASGNTVEGKLATNIYGSVSAADVAGAVRAVLQQKDLAGRIVLEDSDIKFIRAGTGEDAADRVKQIGEYVVEVKVKGHEEAIRRKVRVLAEAA